MRGMTFFASPLPCMRHSQNLEILVTRVNQARFSLAPSHPSILSAGDSSYVFSKSEGLPRRARLSLRAVIFTSTEIEWLREIYSC